MSDIQIITPGCEEEERGRRGRRGTTGAPGPTGPTGPESAAGPTGPTGATGPGNFPPIIAAATVNSTGEILEQTGFSGITHPVTGEYVLTFTNPPPPTPGTSAIVVLITLASFVGGQSSYLFDALDQVHVYTFDATGAAANKLFSIALFSLV